jgi:hypothetical protein
MDRPALEARPDPNRLQRVPPPLALPGQMCQPTGTIDMQPLQLACNTHARPIGMLHPTGNHQISNPRHRGCKPFRRHLHPAHHSAIRERTPQQVPQRFAGARFGQQLILVQVHGQGAHALTVLSRGTDLWGKHTARDVLALGAADGLHLLFGHHQLERRHILDLAALDDLTCHPLQRALADATGNRTMRHLDIWDRDLGQGVPRVTRLSPWLALTSPPLAPWAAAQPIAGGWFAAIVAILGKSHEQRLHLGL